MILPFSVLVNLMFIGLYTSAAGSKYKSGISWDPNMICNGRTQLFQWDGQSKNNQDSHGHKKQNCRKDWGYENNGADKWPFIYPTCSGRIQSPVNINTMAARISGRLTRFRFNGYNTPVLMTLRNNGHSAQVDVLSNAYISGGDLPERYKLVQFHFHWGSDNTRGSEHTVDRRTAPMEVHLVHYRESLGSFDNAKNRPGGLAVIGIFYKTGGRNNPVYNDLTNKLSFVVKPGSPPVPIAPVLLHSLFPTITSNYFRYAGSLTTPPCSQSVIWTVIHKAMYISNTQMQSFRQLLSSEQNGMFPVRLVNNYRPIQPLYGRIIETSRFI